MGKRFSCCHPGCPFSTDRMGVLQSHTKVHLASPSSSTSTTPVRKAGSSPLGKRSPRKSSSPLKSHTPSKRGRPSGSAGRKEAKVPTTIKKEAILEGWSDGEEDEDDKMVVLGEEPPPTLKLFDTCTSSCVDEKSGELIKQDDGGVESSPSKKGPATKTMNDVFEELLRTTKPPEVDSICKQEKEKNIVSETTEEEDVESSEVSSDEEMRDEVIMRTKTVKEDVPETMKKEEEKDSETAGSEMKEEEEALDETITKDTEENVEEISKKEEVEMNTVEEEDIKQNKVEEEGDTDIENNGERSFEKSIEAESLASTEPEDELEEPSADDDIANSRNIIIETVEEKIIPNKEEILPPAVDCTKVASPGPPLLLAEAPTTLEVTPTTTTLPAATPPPTPSSSLPPTTTDILDSPRPPRPTAAVKPTTTSASPGTGTAVTGVEIIEDNVEKNAAIAQTASGSSAGGSPPVLEPEQIVHVLPVENSDGTLTYMILSVDQSSQPRITLDHTDHNAGMNFLPYV